MKITLILLSVFLSLFSVSASAQLSREAILQKIEAKSVRMEREFKLFSYEKLSPDTLDKLAGRYKMADPKFKVDFLYYLFTMDDKYKYKIFFNHENGACVLEIAPRDLDSHIRICYQDMTVCSDAAKTDSSQGSPENLKRCYDKSASCQRMPNVKSLNLTTVDKKYCKAAYGVEL